MYVCVPVVRIIRLNAWHNSPSLIEKGRDKTRYYGLPSLSHRQLCPHLWQSDMSNFRTLCTPCHQAETRKLHARMGSARLARASVGTRDIREFFAPR